MNSHSTLPIEVSEEDLEMIRDSLSAVYNYLMARDMMRAAEYFSEMIEYSPLTTQIRTAQQRADGLLKDHLLRKYDGEDE